MIITRTPYRVSLFGGGTDHPSWFKENNGAVFSFAIETFGEISFVALAPAPNLVTFAEFPAKSNTVSVRIPKTFVFGYQ